ALLALEPAADRTRLRLHRSLAERIRTDYAEGAAALDAEFFAGAPVTDWRDYDTIYTERYMSTPQDNPDGYVRTSAIEGAANLHGRLLIAHGTIDDNVHVQNSIMLIAALQRANKLFETAIYPGSRHGIWSRQYRMLQWDFIKRTMGVDEPTDERMPIEGSMGGTRIEVSQDSR
ncbi:MAG: prolyl oligopeptidase family serine peptidase, partial [Phycisphaerales bacterium]